jgi:hypothetical protein
MVTPAQLSDGVGAVHVTIGLHVVIFAGQLVNDGGVLSTTVTVNTQLEVLPWPSSKL